MQDTAQALRGRLRALQHVSPLSSTQHDRFDRTIERDEPRKPRLSRCRHRAGVAILTALTRQKSHSTRPNFDTEEIGRYRVRGGGRGCDPVRPYEGGPRNGRPAGNQRYGIVNEPCSGPVGSYLLDLLSIDKYRPEIARGQPRRALLHVRNIRGVLSLGIRLFGPAGRCNGPGHDTAPVVLVATGAALLRSGPQ